MANPTFEQMLAQQAANPNFLGGVITAGAAKLMSDRTLATSNSISKLNESLKIISDEPLTTAQQTEQLNNDPSVKDKLKTITEQAQDYQAMTQNVIARKEKYSQVYDQALTELATIGGEDAQRLAKVLQSRKEDALAGLDEKAQVPERVLRYQALQTEFAWNQDKYNKWWKDEKYAEDLAIASDLISNDPKFKEIKGGDVHTWSEKDLDNFTKLQKEITSRALQGRNFSPGVVTDAFSLAMKGAGKSFSFKKLNPLISKQLASIGTENEAEKKMLPTVLTMLSDYRRSLDPKIVEWARAYSRGNINGKEGVLPTAKDITDAGYSDKLVNEILGKVKDVASDFGTRGAYMKMFTKLQDYYPDIYATGEDGTFKNFIEEKLPGGLKIKYPKDPLFRGIDVPGSFNTWSLDNPYLYDTSLYAKIKKNEQVKYDSLNTAPLESGGQDNFSNNILNYALKVPSVNSAASFSFNILKDISDNFGLNINIPSIPSTYIEDIQNKIEENKINRLNRNANKQANELLRGINNEQK